MPRDDLWLLRETMYVPTVNGHYLAVCSAMPGFDADHISDDKVNSKKGLVGNLTAPHSSSAGCPTF